MAPAPPGDLRDRAPEPEVLSDYRGYDFRSAWKGREKVTAVERGILTQLLDRCDRRRVLELGVGFGRLTPTVARGAGEYLGVDLNEAAFPRDHPTAATPGRRWIVANAYHLPFAPESLTTAVMVRLHHHLEHPERVYAELGRVLVPGGSLLVSFAPKTSLATLELDVRERLRRSGPRVRPSVSLSATPRAVAASRPHPIFVPSRAQALRELRGAGFHVAKELAPPPESFERRADPKGSISLSDLLPHVPWVATSRFVLAIKNGTPPHDLPPSDDLLVCPRCRAHLPFTGTGSTARVKCPECGFSLETHDGVLHARYAP